MKLALAVFFALPLMCMGAATAKQPKDPVPAAAVKQEFESFIEKFRSALKANDAAAIAAMTRLPYQNDEAIRTAEQFRAKVYVPYFTSSKRTCIQRGKALYDRDGYKNEYYSIFCGDDIFVFSRSSTGFQFTDISVND